VILRDRTRLDQTRRPLVIGHRGAARVAPENSLEGFAAAIAASADLVEFDVDAAADGNGLIVGHPGVVTGAPPLPLDEVLAYLATQTIGVHVDLKLAGAEREIAAAIRRHGLGERTLVSTTWARSLRRFAVEGPELTRSISYPRDRLSASSIPWPASLVRGSASALRAAMPLRAGLLLAAGRANALSLHHALVSPAVVQATHSRDAALIAWTVNEPARVEELAAAGVDAIVSDDPQMTVAVLATMKAP
jgi:glycerophosphoryl diester phosphodiesterase